MGEDDHNNYCYLNCSGTSHAVHCICACAGHVFTVRVDGVVKCMCGALDNTIPHAGDEGPREFIVPREAMVETTEALPDGGALVCVKQEFIIATRQGKVKDLAGGECPTCGVQFLSLPDNRWLCGDCGATVWPPGSVRSISEGDGEE